MKLQDVFGLNESRMKVQVDSYFKQPKMKLQVVSNFNLVNNGAKNCFRAQTSQESNHKLIPISNNRK